MAGKGNVGLIKGVHGNIHESLNVGGSRTSGDDNLAKRIDGGLNDHIGKRKENTLQSRRSALAYILKKSVVYKLFEEIAPKYAERNGGYTRIIKAAPRRGDGAEMAILELVD